MISTGNWSTSIGGLFKPINPNGICPKTHYRKPHLNGFNDGVRIFCDGSIVFVSAGLPHCFYIQCILNQLKGFCWLYIYIYIYCLNTYLIMNYQLLSYMRCECRSWEWYDHFASFFFKQLGWCPPRTWCPRQTAICVHIASFISHRPDRKDTLASDLKGAGSG